MQQNSWSVTEERELYADGQRCSLQDPTRAEDWDESYWSYSGKLICQEWYMNLWKCNIPFLGGNARIYMSNLQNFRNEESLYNRVDHQRTGYKGCHQGYH